MGCPLRNILVVFTALLTFYVGLSAFWRSNKLQEDTKLVDSKQVRLSGDTCQCGCPLGASLGRAVVTW